MALSYDTAWRELTLRYPSLPQPLAERFLNRALEDLSSRRDWWCFRKSVGIGLVSDLTTGGLTATKGSSSFTINATALAAWNALGPPVPSLRQVRLSTTGPIYRILSIDLSTGEGTFDREVWEESQTAGSYTLGRWYVKAPTDFKRWAEVSDPVQGRKITWAKFTQRDLDTMDPQRNSSGDPIHLVPLLEEFTTTERASSTPGSMWFEVWPHYSGNKILDATYQAKSPQLTDAQYFPEVLPEELIIRAASVKALEHLVVQPNLDRDVRLAYRDQLLRYQADLEGTALKPGLVDQAYLLDRGKGNSWASRSRPSLRSFPLDANYLQSHLGVVMI